jgi:hypothetical protein
MYHIQKSKAAYLIVLDVGGQPLPQGLWGANIPQVQKSYLHGTPVNSVICSALNAHGFKNRRISAETNSKVRRTRDSSVRGVRTASRCLGLLKFQTVNKPPDDATGTNRADVGGVCVVQEGLHLLFCYLQCEQPVCQTVLQVLQAGD